MSEKQYNSEQEAFWAGDFGTEYISRNKSQELLASNLMFFCGALKHAGRFSSCTEFGANIGMNLKALQLLYPGVDLYGVEINPTAADELSSLIGVSKVFCGSILDYTPKKKTALCLIKGVLIHIEPTLLPQVYDKLVDTSEKYILVAEYYNPAPVAIPYRGHNDRLFKRDFAGEMMDRHSNLRIIDYGFAYKRDPAFPQDDITWFLMEKVS